MDDPTPRPIIAVDLMRFSSALLVVAFHYGSAFYRAPSPAAAAMLPGLRPPEWLTAWSWFGWVGAEIFFVISGFVIAFSAEGASMGGFLRRRLLRLLPAVWICATATILILRGAVPSLDLIGPWLASIAFWPTDAQIDPSYWTLGIELYFYLLIATCLGSAGRPGSIERRAMLLGGASAAFWLFALVTAWPATTMMNDRGLQLLLLPHGCFFALGILVRAILNRGATIGRCSLFAIFSTAALVEIAARTVERAGALRIVATPAIPILVFAAALIVLPCAARIQPVLERHIDRRVAATLGLMTYPLYLIHQEVGAVIVGTLAQQGLSLALALTTALVAVLGFAWLVARLFEPAVRKMLAAAIDAAVGLIVRHGPRRDNRPIASPPAG